MGPGKFTKAFEELDQSVVVVGVHFLDFDPWMADLGGQLFRSGDIVIADDDLVKVGELGQVAGGVLADGASAAQG